MIFVCKWTISVMHTLIGREWLDHNGQKNYYKIVLTMLHSINIIMILFNEINTFLQELLQKNCRN